jgi:hypothetical protein
MNLAFQRLAQSAFSSGAFIVMLRKSLFGRSALEAALSMLSENGKPSAFLYL